MSSDFPPVDLAQWRARVEKDLKGRDFEKSLVLPDEEGIPLQPVYDASNSVQPENGSPGAAPFVRGTTAKPGFLRIQEHDESDSELLLRLIDEDMEARLDGIRIRLDRRHRLGSDPLAEKGLSTDGALLFEMGALRDVLKPAFEIENRKTPLVVSLDAGGNALPMAGCALALRELESSTPETLAFHFNADPTAALVRDGRLPRSLAKMKSEGLSLALACAKAGGADRALAVDGEIWQEAGASCARELGLMLADLADWFRCAEKSRVDPKILASQIVLRIGMERDIFLGIAKLRALRRLWSSLVAHFGVTEVAPLIWATTARRTLSQIDPWVNILRASTQGLSAITGGADIVSVRPFDLLADGHAIDADEWGEGAGDDDNLFTSSHESRRDSSTRLGRRLARNTLLVLDEEARLGAVQDPAGGSFYLEQLTEELAERGFAAFQEIEKAGGIATMLADGALQRLLWDDHVERTAALTSRKNPITGVTEFPVLEDGFEPEVELDRAREHSLLREHLRQHKKARGHIGGLNLRLQLVESVVDAAARGATVDELSLELQDKSEAPSTEPPPCIRDSWKFEQLRFRATFTGRPVAYLATLGAPIDHLPRLGFARNLYNIAALDVVTPPSALPEAPLDAADVIAEEALARHTGVICLVGTDAAYDALASDLIGGLRERIGDEIEIHLAGRLQPERQAELEAKGLTKTIHLGCDVHEVLNDLVYAANMEEDWDDEGLDPEALEDDR